MNFFRRRPWTQEEDKFLRECMQASQLQRVPAVAGRSMSAVYKRCIVLGLKSPSATYWLTSELRILEEHIPKLGLFECAKLLPRHSCEAIRTRAWLMGLKYPAVKYVMPCSELDKRIQAFAESNPLDANFVHKLAMELQVFPDRIHKRMAKLGIELECIKHAWSSEEDDILYASDSITEAQQALKRAGFVRSEVAVGIRWRRLGWHHQNNDCYTVNDLAKGLGVGRDTVERWCKKGFLKTPSTTAKYGAKAWTRTEVKQFLYEHQNLWEMKAADQYFVVYTLTVAETDC